MTGLSKSYDQMDRAFTIKHTTLWCLGHEELDVPMKIVSSCHVHVGIAFEDHFALMSITNALKVCFGDVY